MRRKTKLTQTWVCLVLVGAILVQVVWVAFAFVSTWSENNVDLLSDLPPSNAAPLLLKNLSASSKFLQYGSTSGWANQVISLEHAMWLAHATNRTLVLPPVLKHFEATQWTYVDNTVDQVYVRQSPHVRMTQVLDLTSWQDTVSMMDWINFQHYRSTQKRALTEKDAKQLKEEIRCNKVRLVQDKSLHGTTVRNETCGDWIGIDTQPYEYRLADMQTELAQYQHLDVLTFNFIFPDTLFGHANGMQPVFQLVYQRSIRTLARQLMTETATAANDLGNSTDNNSEKPHYVAIHVRGGDQPYSMSNWTELFNDTLIRVGEELSKDSTLSTLLVISDICHKIQNPKLLVGRQWQVFYYQKILQGHNIKLVFSSDFASTVQKASTRLGIPNLDIMVDQQMAACADVFIAPDRGMRGHVSTFAKRIQSMREQRVNICATN